MGINLRQKTMARHAAAAAAREAAKETTPVEAKKVKSSEPVQETKPRRGIFKKRQ